SVISTGTASASNGHRSKRDGDSKPPTMELVIAPNGVQTFLPWAPRVTQPPAPTTTQAAPQPASSTSEVARPSPLTHVVAPGEHLWSIAEDTVTARLGASADPDRIRSYWLELIQANRDRLTDPDNTDFILPGQVLRLP
ncbi:MAG TPA: LysM peptidoglycan-binding domain-containing protein, partial [Microthrixaceae bacterium]|nr:LysM peptidoglycan-binding domain-containing protein [Microthrixaceae bacterium]